jgi:hypothetical protein
MFPETSEIFPDASGNIKERSICLYNDLDIYISGKE